jgi:hypothetical protein
MAALTHQNSQTPFLLWLPKLSVALLVVAVLSLLWVLHLNEQEEQRNTLINQWNGGAA